MPDPDYKALCAELVTDINEWMVGTDHRPMSSVELVDRARAALSHPEPVEATDEELSGRFRAWWHNEGSGLLPLPVMDHEEHVRRISEIAWANGAYVARWDIPANTINQED